MALLGTQSFAVLLCRLSDQPQTPQPASFFQGFLASSTGLAGYWSSVSNGQFSMQMQIFGWKKIPKTPLKNFMKLSRQAKVAACKAGFPKVNFANFFAVIAIVNTTVGDAGYDGAGGILLDYPGAWNLGEAEHESGHALGLGHSFDDRPASCDAYNDNRAGVYSDAWCIMSYACFGGANPAPTFNTNFGASGPELGGAYRDSLGWIPQNRIFAGPRANTSVMLAALNNPQASGGFLLQKIYVDNAQTQYYTIEFRQKQSWDQGIPQDTVLIHMVKNGRAYLIRAKGGPQRLQGSVYLDNSNTPTLRITVRNLNSVASTAVVDVAVAPEGPPAVGDPAAMVTPDQEHIFYQGQEGSIFHEFRDSSSGLHSEQWVGPGAPIAAPATAGKAATLVTPNQQHIFYRCTDGAIAHVVYDAIRGLNWERWTGSGTSTNAPKAAGDPASLAANNQQHMFYRAGDGTIWHVFFDPNSGLNSERWAGPGSSTNAPSAAGNPATLAANNQQHMFYRTTDNQIWHVLYDQTKGLQSEEWATSGSAAGDLGTLAANNQQHVFYVSDVSPLGQVDNFGALMHVYWDPVHGIKNETWVDAQSTNPLPPALNAVPAAVLANNQEHVFYRSADGSIWDEYLDPASGRHSQRWTGPGSPTGSPLSIGDPAAVVVSNEVHIFYRGPDDVIWHVYSSGKKNEMWAFPGNGKVLPLPAVGTPATLVWGNQQHIFYSDTAQSLIHTFWEPGAGIFGEPPFASIQSEQRAGRLTFPPGASGDSATLLDNNQQHVFYVSVASELMHLFFDPNAGFQSEIWVGVPSSPPPPPVTSDQPALYSRPAAMAANNQQHTVYRTAGSRIMHVFWDPNKGISSEQWAGAPGAPKGTPSASGGSMAAGTYFYSVTAVDVTGLESRKGTESAAIKVTGSTSSVSLTWTPVPGAVFYKIYRTVTTGVYNSPAFLAQTAAPSFSDTLISPLPGTPPATAPSTKTINTPDAVGNPAALAANNQQHVFYRTAQNQIWHLLWDPSKGLSSELWAGPGSSGNIPAAGGDPAALFANNQQHVFYRTTDLRIWHVFFDPSSGMHNEQWAGAGGRPHLGPDPAGDPAALDANNQQHIFYRTTDGGIAHVFWDPNKGLQSESWAGPSSSSGAPAAGGDPAAMTANNQQHIFYRGTDGRIYHVLWDSNIGLSWEHWTIGLPGWIPPWP